ncbi:MAG: 2Fe-2S iron-sulfur cluster binding domain-containing protein [Proteobacteria bacterium]|nr:2Fe-2S iron-sulfur cluster binding domain-containing protein [Pseudomonadota bacterium]
MAEAESQGRLGPALWDAIPNKWNADADDTLVCAYVRPETHDVKSFLFRTVSPRLFRFRPGQFITIEVEIDGQVINRCYTISSPPTRPDTLSITVKRKPGGKVSNWLHDNLKPGMTIKALGPSGEFGASLHPSTKYLFLSGGSGVTPLMSMSRTFYELGEDRDVIFVHSARTPRDIIFRHELTMMANGLQKFRTAFVCEQTGEHRDWSAPVGFLSLPLLKSIAPDFVEREIFCCGPEAYMANVRGMLKDAGFDMARYHEESFTFENLSTTEKAEVQEALTAEAPSGSFKIEFTKSGRTIDCRPDQFILDAAKAAGLRLPFSCSKGVCGTCKSKKLSGQVAMAHGGGIRQREIDAGMVLICCSKPLSDVVIEK